MRFLNNKHREKGLKAEEEACGFLKTLGFEMVERNFFSQFGEIDIIALKKGFCISLKSKAGKILIPFMRSRRAN